MLHPSESNLKECLEAGRSPEGYLNELASSAIALAIVLGLAWIFCAT